MKSRAPPALPSAAALEALLDGPPTLETDVIAFLEGIGWYFRYGPLHRFSDEVQRARLYDTFCDRRSKLSPRDKAIETRAAIALTTYYGDAGGYRSIGELKAVIEGRGLDLRGLSYLGLSQFNGVLRQYGMPPIKVGGRTSRSALRRFGLDKYEGA